MKELDCRGWVLFHSRILCQFPRDFLVKLYTRAYEEGFKYVPGGRRIPGLGLGQGRRIILVEPAKKKVKMRWVSGLEEAQRVSAGKLPILLYLRKAGGGVVMNAHHRPKLQRTGQRGSIR